MDSTNEMSARSLRLALLVLLAFLPAHAGVITDISTYTNGASGGIDSSPSSWTLVILLFDSGGSVTDISVHNEVTNLDLSTAGSSASYLTSTSGGLIPAETLDNIDTVGTPAIGGLPAAVPEPSTFLLLALGAAGVWWLRRR